MTSRDLNLFKIDRISLYLTLYLRCRSREELSLANAEAKQDRWCREGEFTHTKLPSTDFESPVNTVNL